MADDAQPDYSDGTMIALYPPRHLAEELAVPGGLPADELHMTVAYTGGSADVDAAALTAAGKQLGDRGPITATIAGHARFTGGENGDVIVALVDSADVEVLRADTLAALAEQNIDVPREHGFTAHITLAYIPAGDPSPIDRLDARPVVFTAVTAVHGNDRTDTPFTVDNQESAAGHPIAPYARTAFAQGWASSGGPMTERVKAGSIAAIEYAVAHEHDADVLEATLRLGHLEGVWAAVYERRDKVLADTQAAVLATWRDMIGQIDMSGIIAWYRAGEGLLSENDPATQRAVDAARTLLHALPETDGWAQIRQDLRDGIVAGQTEGHVDGLALAADNLGKIGFDYTAAYNHFHAALSGLDSTWAQADSWLTQMVDGAAADLGRKLASLTADRASYEDMLTAAGDILDSENVRSVAYVVDMAVHQSLSVGALDLWNREGVSEVDYFTAGDARVCPACELAEADGPYRLGEAPQPPLHGFCRCTLAARNPISLATLAPFLPMEVA